LWRRVLAAVLAVVAIFAIVLSLLVGWVKTTLTDEDQFVSTLADLPANDAVATTLSLRLADRIVERTGVTEFVVRVLPEPLEFLAAPLTVALTNSVADAAHDVITSDGFAELWDTTLRVTHRSASVVLKGTDEAISSSDGSVTIDLDAIAGIVSSRVEARGITLPDLDVEFGEIVIYESDQLAAAQAAVRTLNAIGWLVPVLAMLLIAVSLWAAPDRRRMTVFLSLGTAVGLLIFLALLRTGANSLLAGIDDATTHEAAVAVWDALTQLLIQTTWAFLVVSLIVGFAAWVGGPSPRSVQIRGWTRGLVARWGEPGHTEGNAISRFLDAWLRVIEVGILIVATLFILLGPSPTPISVIVTAVISIALIVAVEVVAGPNHAPTDEASDVSP